jgi:hypothetical protein
VFPEELMRVLRLYSVEYHCPYDEVKVKDMLRGLGREEVEAILAEQGAVVIRKEMCNHEYCFDAGARRDVHQSLRNDDENLSCSHSPARRRSLRRPAGAQAATRAGTRSAGSASTHHRPRARA